MRTFYLSWEIAFRWNEEDPHLYENPSQIPLKVKDTIRVLASEIFDERLYSNLYLSREEGNRLIKKRFLRSDLLITPAISDRVSDFRKLIADNHIDPKFLKSVLIQFWELEYWAREFNIDFPNFWLRSIVMGGEFLPIADKVFEIGHYTKDTSHQDSKVEALVSTQHQKAAYARHQPVYDLKKECISYWLAHSSLSFTQAANRFYDPLPQEKKRLLSPTNGVVTLAKAISDYKNRDKLKSNDKLPIWLLDFNPEP